MKLLTHPLRLSIAVAIILASATTGCTLDEILHKTSAYVVFQVTCDDEKKKDECTLRPVSTLTLSAFPESQKVIGKVTRLGSEPTEYVEGKNCRVISRDDFSCDQITVSDGKASRSDQSNVSEQTNIDNHIVSWILWYASSKDNPRAIDFGLFSLLATFIGSALLGFLGGFVGAIGLILTILLAVLVFLVVARSTDQSIKERRKALGYDDEQ